MFYVYALLRSNGRPFWIGKGKGARLKATVRPEGTNSRKKAVINKTVALLGVVPTVVIHDGLDEATAFAYERALISAIGRFPNGPLVNLTDGGEGVSGVKYTEERRAKASAIKIGNKNALGTKHTPETRAKLSACKLGNKGPTGRKQSPEHRAKRIAASAAWRKTPEGQAKMAQLAAAHVGRKRSDETRAKIKAARALQQNAGRWRTKQPTLSDD